MLKNYSIDKCGVVYQVKKNLYTYNDNYIKNSYGFEPVRDNMSHLRFGHLVGSIGRVPNQLLDIGYGNGSFLHTAQSVVKECFGSDILPAYPLPDGVCFVDDIFANYYEVVTFYDSLEHFDDIYIIGNLKCKYVVVSVPYCHYLNDKWFENWKHRKPDEHLWHFNERSLISFMSAVGFSCVNISSIEDVIRKPVDDLANILTGVFVRE